jgi:hypothetical protein
LQAEVTSTCTAAGRGGAAGSGMPWGYPAPAG